MAQMSSGQRILGFSSRYFRWDRRHYHVFALLFFLINISCGNGTPSTETSQTASLIANYDDIKWPNPRRIPVCIINPRDVSDRLRTEMVNHVKKEYAFRAGIGFVGFNECRSEDYDPNSPSIRILFKINRSWQGVGVWVGTGGQSAIGRFPVGCSLGSDCGRESMIFEIDRDYGSNFAARDTALNAAIHEFGHALGLYHEHARTDSYNCPHTDERIPQSDYDVYVGPYDPHSIMNYCSGGPPELSPGDVEGLQRLYPILKEGLYGSQIIKNEASGKCLDVDQFSFDLSARVLQWDCHAMRNQRWFLKDVGDEKFEIRSASTDLCLDVVDLSKANGAKVVQWFCTGSDNQHVKVIDRGNGKKSFQFVHSGRCLDVASGRPDNGIQLQQWDCFGNSAQSFFMNYQL